VTGATAAVEIDGFEIPAVLLGYMAGQAGLLVVEIALALHHVQNVGAMGELQVGLVLLVFSSKGEFGMAALGTSLSEGSVLVAAQAGVVRNFGDGDFPAAVLRMTRGAGSFLRRGYDPLKVVRAIEVMGGEGVHPKLVAVLLMAAGAGVVGDLSAGGVTGGAIR